MAAPHDSSSVEQLKPRKGSFVFPRLVKGLIGFTLAGGALSLVLAAAGQETVVVALAGAGVFLLGNAFASYAALVAYSKERYELHPSHIRCRKGGVFSDETTELDIRLITHVKLRLPWLRHWFYGVGDVMIESAGSGGSEITLQVVRHPERLYERVRGLMQANGYALRQEELLHEEHPDLIGTIVECAGLFIGAAVALLLPLAGIISQSATGEGNVDRPEDGGFGLLFLFLGLVTFAGAVVSFAVRFLDLRRRTYRVFSDVVIYEEGFLTRTNAFIPFENIADANSKRGFLDQILGLYDVQVSCQGSGAEITFRRLRRGEELSRAISRLVESARTRPRPSDQPLEASGSGEVDSGVAQDLLQPPEEPELVKPEDAWTAELRMHGPRVWAPLIFTLPMVPIWLILMVEALIRVSVTRFSVRPSSVGYSYKFLTATEREFAYDKITGVVVKTNPWDRLFKTVSVQLWSIGADQPLGLVHVKRSSLNLEALLRQVGIPAAPEVSGGGYAVQTAFGLGAWIRARLPGALTLLLGALALVWLGVLVHEGFYLGLVALGLATVVGLLYSRAYFARQTLHFHEYHVQAEQGVFWKRHFYARYSYLKKVEVVRYPTCDLGSVKVFVAGEGRIAKGRAETDGTKKGVRVPYSFTTSYVTRISEQSRLIDDLLLGRVVPSRGVKPAEPLDVIAETRPAIGNSVLQLVLLSMLILPLVALLPISIPWLVVAVRRRQYRIEAGRVVKSWGILYKHKASVLFNRIDTMRHGAGIVNKLFKNGNVTLFTAGSSSPDISLTNIPGYQGFYESIRKHYGKSNA